MAPILPGHAGAPLTNAAQKSVSGVMSAYAPAARAKLRRGFAAVDAVYPPLKMTWIALKHEKLLLLFAKDRRGFWRQVLSYPVIGASGSAGPKLQEGDKQVPEGFYELEGFRPNVIAHLGLAVNYPNVEDRAHARDARRQAKLGCDILIHGSRWSTGCLAMENEPIEELFVLAHDTGCKNIRLVFAPCNLALHKPIIQWQSQPKWLPDLYRRLAIELRTYPLVVDPLCLSGPAAAPVPAAP